MDNPHLLLFRAFFETPMCGTGGPTLKLNFRYQSPASPYIENSGVDVYCISVDGDRK